MRKPTVLISVEMGCTDEQCKRVAEALAILNAQFAISLSPVRLYQTKRGVDPFEHIECPGCENKSFVSVDLAAVQCENCLSTFSVRPTAGDPGFVVDCHINGDGTKLQHPILFNQILYRIVKEFGDDSGWLMRGNPYGITPLNLYLKENAR